MGRMAEGITGASFMPLWMTKTFAFSLGYLLLTFGTCLLLGIKTRAALLFTGLLYCGLSFGLMAVRDYAMIYYAVFFFLAQELATDPRARRFLLLCFAAACLAQPIAATASDSFPEFFLSKLVINGVPLGSLFKPFLHVTQVDDQTVRIDASGSAVFSNWIPFRRQIEQLGMKVKYLGGDGICTTEIVKLSGGAKMIDNVTCAEGGASIQKMPGGTAWKARYDAKYPGQFQVYSPYTYDATMVLADAMKRANSTDPKVYAAKLAESAYQGVTAKLAFEANGELKSPAMTLYAYKDGKKVPVN